MSKSAGWVAFAFVFFNGVALWAQETGMTSLREDSESMTLISTASAPRMQFEETLHDFGRAQPDEKVKHAFIFKNTGGSDLILGSIKPTCGCTAATASTGPYRPGESGAIDVTYDSRGKVGFALKEVRVFSNDPQSPATLSVQGVVLAAAHPQKTVGDALFSGSCAECHSLPARDKSGGKLYDAVCSICHDFPQSLGKNAVAPDRGTMSKLSKRSLKKLITHGAPNSSMPGFGYRAGGPLTEDQIQSLVEYIESLRTQ
ncbi:MAG: DUF1573 domain-containing protein [Elusimicrobia bacterium]|nr:DUF1573 domain-containing protein [Elusimicrobiota bacterium]